MSEVKKPKRPKARDMKKAAEAPAKQAAYRGQRAAAREAEQDKDLVMRKAGGGMCRGMGKATRGGKYKMS